MIDRVFGRSRVGLSVAQGAFRRAKSKRLQRVSLYRSPPTLLQIISKEIHRSLQPCDRRSRRCLRVPHFSMLLGEVGFVAHWLFRLLTSRRRLQQLPRLPILFILRHGAAQANRSHAAHRLLGNDVPRLRESRTRPQNRTTSPDTFLLLLFRVQNLLFALAILDISPRRAEWQRRLGSR